MKKNLAKAVAGFQIPHLAQHLVHGFEDAPRLLPFGLARVLRVGEAAELGHHAHAEAGLRVTVYVQVIEPRRVVESGAVVHGVDHDPVAAPVHQARQMVVRQA